MMVGLGGLLFGGLIMLLFWLLVIAAVVWLVVTVARGDRPIVPTRSPGQTPLEILKMRYARGEITKEQYDQMRQDLGA